MFSVREEHRPTAQSAELVDKYVDLIVRRSSDPEHIEDYVVTHKERIAFDVDYADRFLPPGGRVLEIGGYPFLLTLPLVEKGFDVTTVDKEQGGGDARPLAGEFRFETVRCDLDTDRIPVADASFDCVIMNEVFEHLRINLIATMGEILRVLKPGGRLLLSTPNIRSIRGFYNLFRKKECYVSMGDIYENYSLLEKYGVMGHVREYTAREVSGFLSRVGLMIEGVVHRGHYPDAWWLWKLSNRIHALAPELRPYFSIVAQKPASAPTRLSLAAE